MAREKVRTILITNVARDWHEWRLREAGFVDRGWGRPRRASPNAEPQLHPST